MLVSSSHPISNFCRELYCLFFETGNRKLASDEISGFSTHTARRAPLAGSRTRTNPLNQTSRVNPLRTFSLYVIGSKSAIFVQFDEICEVMFHAN